MLINGREPSFWIGVITSCVLAVVTTLMGQGVLSDAMAGRLTDGVNAVAQIITLLAPIIAALVIRQRVTPTSAPVLDKGTVVTVETPGDEPNEQVTV
jgi:hypothetical protein